MWLDSGSILIRVINVGETWWNGYPIHLEASYHFLLLLGGEANLIEMRCSLNIDMGHESRFHSLFPVRLWSSLLVECVAVQGVTRLLC